MTHPDFEVFTVGWELTLRSEGYAANTLKTYGDAVRSFAGWLADTHPDLGPGDVKREHIRGWVAHIRDTRSSATARGWLAGLRHFFRWAHAEDEIDTDPTEGVRMPPPGEPQTPVLTLERVRALLATCAGKTFVARRDAAILRLFLDGGLRLSELAGLAVGDVEVRERIVYVRGKATRRSGARHRAVPVGVRTAQALERYLRERRRHPYADTTRLWLGDRGREAVSADGIKRMLQRRAAAAGLGPVHPHQLRHTWAHEFRAAGGSEGDLMMLGGWRSRQMLDRYGATAAAGRAHEAYRRLSLGDRL